MRRRLLILGAVLVLVASGVIGVRLFSRPTPSDSQPDAAALGLLLLDAEDGLLVLAVSDRSTADQAGLQPGDHILCVEGEVLEEPQKFNDCLQKGTEAVTLTVRRNEQEIQLRLPCR